MASIFQTSVVSIFEHYTYSFVLFRDSRYTAGSFLKSTYGNHFRCNITKLDNWVLYVLTLFQYLEEDVAHTNREI